jgi:hypothetical protein
MGPIFQNIAYLEDIHVHHLYFACNFNMIDALIFLFDFLLDFRWYSQVDFIHQLWFFE